MTMVLALLLFGDLHTAARAGDLQAVEALLEKGADVNEYDQLGGTPLHDAAWNGQAAIVTLLLDRGAKINARHKEAGSTPLHYAVLMNRRAAVEVLLKRGADINACFTSATAISRDPACIWPSPACPPKCSR